MTVSKHSYCTYNKIKAEFTTTKNVKATVANHYPFSRSATVNVVHSCVSFCSQNPLEQWFLNLESSVKLVKKQIAGF